MFSPDASIHAVPPSQRNPRRRQRTHSDDSFGVRPPAKRVRTPLAHDTFEPVWDQQTNGHATESLVANGHAVSGRSTRDASSDTTSLAYRVGKKQEREKRGGQGDGSVVLVSVVAFKTLPPLPECADTVGVHQTKNDNYILAQLPALPDPVRSSKERMRSLISAKTGHALVFTRTHAIIWPYTSNNTSPDPSRTYTITLPHSARNVSDPLPLGALVPGPASAEPGLLVIGPTTGRITFWEDISTAATEDLMRQKQHGFQSSTGSMLYGETVTNVTSAEPAGFVLTFSTGRIAHLNVRDLQGKPAINVRFLRGSGNNQTGTLLGGLKNVFGGGAWKRDIVAVSTGTSRSRGQRNVIVATSKAVLQMWDLNWSGNDSLQHEIDAEEDLLAALREGGATVAGQKEHTLMVLDVTIVTTNERSREIAPVGGNQGFGLLALVALSGEDSTRYALVEMTLVKGSVIVDVVHPITCYTTPTLSSQNWPPKVYLPHRSHTAFVVFATAVVLVSLVRIEESPESQLLMDSHKLPQPFQDVVQFRQNDGFEVIGCSIEDQGSTQKLSGCVMMIRSFGVVRVAALPLEDGADAFHQAKVTAKAKIEQAVFYGSMAQNLIDFTRKSTTTFAQEEVEAAALEISDEILKSSSNFIPAITPSLDLQLKLRATALRDLIRHTNANYPSLSRLAKWKLLWNAEKLAAARVVWKNYDASLKRKGKDQSSLLYELVEMLHEQFKTENQPEQGESDPVRHWFIKDVWRIEYVVPWAFNAVQELYQEGTKDHPSLLRLVSEANDVSLGALETALKFREENAGLYGLGNEVFDGGVLRQGFEGLPEFWTSTKPTILTTRQLVDFARELTFKYYDKPPAEGDPDQSLVKKVAGENARQVDVCCQIYIERIRWCRVQDDEVNKADGEYLRAAHNGIRGVQLTKLAEIGLLEEGIALAEKYSDMGALVNLIVEALGETANRSHQPGLSDEDEAALDRRMEAIQERMASYFHTYGDKWARALFSKKISNGLLADLLDDGAEVQEFLTRFLRSEPAYAKLSWINEVVNERNYGEASRTLRTHALTHETVLWNKKIELSLAKLAAMAVSEQADPAHPTDGSDQIPRIDHELSLIALQDRLYAHVSPTIRAAIDETAEVDLVMAEFAKHFVKGKPALRTVLEHGFTKLVHREVLSPTELIDVLTLMDEVSYDEEEFGGQEHVIALQALKLSGLAAREPELSTLLKKIIWRRCMIKDNWEAINKTELKADTEVEVETCATALFKTFKEGHKLGFWEGADADHPLKPSDVLGAGCTANELRSRYGDGAEEYREPVARDLRTENNLLQCYVDKGRLEQWFPGVMAAAKQSLRNEAEAASEKATKKKEIEDLIAKGFRERDEELEGSGQAIRVSELETDIFMGL